jgi:hypothetical protein
VTRLDVVVKLRERDEERARLQLADAQRMALAARAAANDAQERARRDERGRGSAAHWELADAAHLQALREAKKAATAAQAADQKYDVTRGQYNGAYARAEAMRRAADSRRDIVLREIDAGERKAMDEIAVLRSAAR